MKKLFLVRHAKAEESALGQKIEKGLVEIICPLLSGVKSKMDTATDKLKQGAISAAN